MNVFRFISKVDIRFGIGILRKAHKVVRDTGFTRFAVIIDSGVRDNKLLRYFLRNLSKEKLSIHIYENPEVEPSYKYLGQFKKLFKNKHYDSLIGIGGGSTMDLTKGLAVLLTNKGRAIKYKGFPKLKYDPLPVILIPSLPGTGSEVAYNAVFTDTDNKMRLGINTELNYPLLTIVDPGLCMSAPKKALISSTMDSLGHTITSFINPNASPITKMYAKEAFKHLGQGINNIDTIEGRTSLCIASILNNISLNNSGGGLEGVFSYVLGANYGVPHGIGEGIFLPPLCRLYVSRGFNGYNELFDLVASPGQLLSINDKNDLFCEYLEQLFFKLGAPTKLEGVTRENIPSIIKQTKKYFKDAPVKVTEEDINKMLEKFITKEVKKNDKEIEDTKKA